VLREPLNVPALALCLGIAAGHYCYIGLAELALPLAAGVALTSLAFGRGCRRWIRLSCVSLTIALAGLALQAIHRPGRPPTLDADDADTVVLIGCVVNPPVFSPDRERFLLELAPRALAQVTVNSKPNQRIELPYGVPVELVAKVRRPRSFQNPGEFDFAAYLAHQRIFWTAEVRNPADIRRLPGACGHRWLGALFWLRTKALDRLERLYPDDPRTESLLAAMLLGQTLGVERRWTDDFRLTGTYHALVISGQHVAVLALTLLFLLRVLLLGRVPALAIATVAIWVYAFLSGMNPPAVRAAAGFTLFLLASYCCRRIRILNSVAAIAMVYLAFDPDLLFDPSFQLSFVSAAAIAAFALPAMDRYTTPIRHAVKRFSQIRYDTAIDDPRAQQWRVELRLVAETLRVWTGITSASANFAIEWVTRLGIFIVDCALISACIQFAVALPMVQYFHRLSVTSLSANVLVVPLFCAVMPAGFAAILTGLRPIAWFTAALLNAGQAIAAGHAYIEPARRITDVPFLFGAGFAAALVTLAICLRLKSRWTPMAGCVAALLFLCIYLEPWPALRRAGWLEVSGLDVSQGDSLLVVFPRGTTMLVDAGGFPGAERMARKPQMDIGEEVVSPYLWFRQIHALDYVVLTHGHSDHMGGLVAVIDNFRPRELWTGVEPPSEGWSEVLRHAAAHGTQVRWLKRGPETIAIDGTTLRVLAPATGYQPKDIAGNDDSLVLEIRYGRRSVLLTGDAEKPVERDMLAHSLLQPVTLLKVGHHGSKTSSSQEFLDAIAPQFALISDGYKNSFHHPHPSVLARLAERHAEVLRTDERGLITFRTDGNKVEIETFR
jgi:competence protein ComEC